MLQIHKILPKKFWRATEARAQECPALIAVGARKEM